MLSWHGYGERTSIVYRSWLVSYFDSVYVHMQVSFVFAGLPKVRSIVGSEVLEDSQGEFLQEVGQRQMAEFKKRPPGAPPERVLPPSRRREVVHRLVGVKVDMRIAGTASGPQASIERLAGELRSRADSVRLQEQARVKAIVGGCRRSLRSVQSGIRCYFKFAEHILKRQGAKLPPKVNDILSWSLMFRSSGTFSNYLGYLYLRVGCMLEGVPTDVFNDPAAKRAKNAVQKRRRFKPRPKMFIKLPLILRIMEACYLEDYIEGLWHALPGVVYIFVEITV